MSNLKWNPKDPAGNVGVPGKGYIASADFSQEDLDNLVKRAKNRKLDVHSFLLKAGLVPAVAQLELDVDVRKFEKHDAPLELNPEVPEQPKLNVPVLGDEEVKVDQKKEVKKRGRPVVE